MKKNKNNPKIIVTLFLFILFCAIGLKIVNSKEDGEFLRLADKNIYVMVANTEEEKFKGLGDRENMGKFDGMLFVYDQPRRLGVVMRDMKFSIDVVWLLNGEVVDIAPELPLQTGALEEDLKVYWPREKANAFLELQAGWTKQHNVKIGDKIEVVE